MSSYEQYIRQAAASRGIDPDIAVRVAKAEGGLNGYIQSNVRKNGVREPSYGPFQLLVGGNGTIFPEGMGNQMMRETGLDPRDPNNAHASIDFALDQARNKGWGQWYGAKAVGLSPMAGIGSQVASQQAAPTQASGSTVPAMGSPIEAGSQLPTNPQAQSGIVGAFAPSTTTQQNTQPNFLGGMSDIAKGNYLDGASQMFGSMSAGNGQQQIPQAPAMQLAPVQGPSSQQATALANYVQSLLGKKVANG